MKAHMPYRVTAYWQAQRWTRAWGVNTAQYVWSTEVEEGLVRTEAVEVPSTGLWRALYVALRSLDFSLWANGRNLSREMTYQIAFATVKLIFVIGNISILQMSIFFLLKKQLLISCVAFQRTYCTWKQTCIPHIYIHIYFVKDKW